MPARDLPHFAPCLAVIVGALVPAAGGAQTYPAKPIRMIVGFPVGGGVDIAARTIAPKLTERFGQQVVVDNRLGAGSAIASDITAKAVPDGYTILMVESSHAVNAAMQPKLPYDSVRDFAPVTLVGAAPMVLSATTSFPAKTVKDLIALAKAKPGQINFATGGVGSMAHLAGELFKKMAAVDIVHVPYKGGSQAMADVIGGQIQLLSFSLPGSLSFIKAGSIRAIAVTSAKRASAAPDIPTFAETGLSGYEAISWYGVLTPAATPKAVIHTLHAEFVRALQQPDIAEALTRQGIDRYGSTPAEFDGYLKAEIAKWTAVVKDARLRPD